jgi:hypothetical protein
MNSPIKIVAPTIHITAAVADRISAITSTGKTCWIVADINTFYAYAHNRTQARELKAAGGFPGQVVKSTEINFEVQKTQHVEFKIPKAPELGAFGKVATEVTHESTIERPCKAVWAIAENMKGQKRGVVLAACVEAGIAYYTARTQYQSWLQIQKEMATATRVSL